MSVKLSDTMIDEIMGLDDEEFCEKFGLSIPGGNYSEDELEDDDNEDEVAIAAECNNLDENRLEEMIEQEEPNNIPEAVSNETEPSTSSGRSKNESLQWRFRRVDFEEPDSVWKNQLPPPPEEDFTPYNYFKMFISDSLMQTISEQSNVYAHQKDGIILASSPDEIEQFISILLQMGIYKMPSVRLYWANECRFNPIADLMSRNRFQTLLKYFHLADNKNLKPPGDPKYDKLFKVQPLLSSLRTALQGIHHEEELSLDEQMIPFKGRSSIKQYIKSKPHKWGYKCFTLAGSSGIMYDFQLYVGKDTCPDYELGFSGNIVMTLTEKIPRNNNYKLFADNWFSSLKLASSLKERGIFFLGTIRSNRMANCPLKSEAELKKKGRGSFDHLVEVNKNISLVRWFDRKSINFISTYCAVDPLDVCKRWSKETRTHVNIDRPLSVKMYNKFMGGVDLCDMLLEFYRINIRSRKWYMRIVFWCFNVAVVNGWLLYRRHEKQKGKKHELTLLQFQSCIARGLATADKIVNRKRGRPSSSSLAHEPKLVIKRKVSIVPISDVRYDNIGHFPVVNPKQGRCKKCSSGFTKFACTKCNVNLCLTQNKNCFLDFHQK